METVYVLYRGKKSGLLLRMKYLSKEYVVHGDGSVIGMTPKDAEELIKRNPVPFSVVAPGNPEHKVPGPEPASHVKEQPSAKADKKETKDSKKYVSQMNKAELIRHAKEKFGAKLSKNKTKRQLRKAIADLEKTAPKLDTKDTNGGDDRKAGPPGN